MSITLEDLEKRYVNVRKNHPEVGECTFEGCKNPLDATMMGLDTSCAYHRLLFDWWLYEVDSGAAMDENTKRRRANFRTWTEELGQEKCDEIVLHMANQAINWAC